MNKTLIILGFLTTLLLVACSHSKGYHHHQHQDSVTPYHSGEDNLGGCNHDNHRR